MIFRAIRKVPPDVLRLIFLMLADAAPAGAAVIPSSCSTLSIEEFMPRRVAQVSRSWRHVAVESTEMAIFNEDFKDFTAMLRKSCLLALQIHRTSGISLDVHIESFSPLCPLIRLLLPTSSHWRSLSLNIGLNMATYTILSPIVRSTACLEIFKLTVIECSCSSPSIVSSQLFLEKITQSSPRLDSVEGVFESLRACNFFLGLVNMVNLQSCTIFCNFAPDEIPRTLMFLKLRDLLLDSPRQQISFDSVVCYPSLATLKIGNCPPMIIT
ncbi:hypothetical protein C8J56DRAFT_987909 [Mycena floridula]|nr:hypothetical protein C8J56DRAFT_987909 [Mycena floridula]